MLFYIYTTYLRIVVIIQTKTRRYHSLQTVARKPHLNGIRTSGKYGAQQLDIYGFKGNTKPHQLKCVLN